MLGAGNIASIAPLDVLYKLYAEGRVCMLKMNPVNDYLGPIFEDIFADLARAGFVRFAYGGADVGEYLTHHDGVDEIHITGSARTHDAIVFGSGEEGRTRKASGQPLTTKRMTSELGNVSPTIVVPGPWSARDLAFQAEHIATQKLHNAGFNCIASQVLITDDTWEQTTACCERSHRSCRRSHDARRTTRVLVRGSRRWRALTRARTLGGDEAAPTTLITGLDSADAEETCFRDEAFAPVLTATTINATTSRSYLEQGGGFLQRPAVGDARRQHHHPPHHRRGCTPARWTVPSAASATGASASMPGRASAS